MSQAIPVYFLLVDDREENLVSLQALLRRDGLELLTARSGPEALELLLRYDVALALLDVQMPGMDGYELAELMRGNSRTGAIPIIFITAGDADDQRRFRGYQSGAVDFIKKPIEGEVLRSKAQIFFQLKEQKNLLAKQRDALQVTAEENARLLEESRRAAAALQEADRRKDEFLAMLAHELRNPLAPISNGLRILRSGPTPEESEEVRSMMDKHLGHLIRLIDDLFDVSRISHGKIELRKVRTRLQDALQDAVEASRSSIDSGEHQFVQKIEAEDLWLEADPTRISQVVSNLLNNASKYTPAGGTIELTARRDGGNAVITVTDTGIGIAPEMLPKLFELFTQVDPNSEKSQGGLGIGLALVRSLVTMHGGEIQARSEGLGSGSAFSVALPLAQPAQSAASSSAAAAESDGQTRSKNLLVVDDNVESAKTMGLLLKLKGHRVELAHTGAEALEKARAVCPDIILLDIGLPDMTGYDVCRAIRNDADLQGALLIAQTGWGQKRDIERAQEAGFEHHLVKPIEIDDLMAMLSDNARPPRLLPADKSAPS